MSAIHHIMTAIDSLQTIPDYLCFTALEAGTFTLTIPAAVTATYLSYVEWSKDGRTWNHTDNTSEAVTIDVQVASGEKVYWRGSGRRMATGYPDGRFSKFSSTCQFDLSGDIRSILYLDDFSVTTTTQQYCFTGLFYGASVIDASNLRLALTGDSAYMMCFRGCTQLVHAPSLMEGGAIMHWQFHTTYQGCNRLVTGTDIQATSVASAGCYYTYRGCTSLMKAPDISSVISVEKQGFYAMFYDCSSLNYVKCLASSFYKDDTASNAATYVWLSGVASTGTFIQSSGVTWPRGASGIPTGWLAYDEGEAIPNDYEQLDYAGNDSGRAWVNVGAVTHVLEAYQITFRTPVIGTQVICGYLGLDTEADPVQASQNYLYARASPDSFQHQHYRISGDSYSSQNGKLQDIRDTEWHTFKMWNDNGCRHMEFDGVDKGASTREYATKKENMDMYLFHYQGTNGYANVHISEFIRYEEDAETETMHLLPCKRKSDDVVGYWDTIGLQFRTSGNAHALIGGYLTNNENNE